ncbi:hypothetical protein NMY22_g17633 [Coprinellus aureogranulatus]|nr:hypothetical protein NMY22_g17633 [Coprinellus aureogranulatus]
MLETNNAGRTHELQSDPTLLLVCESTELVEYTLGTDRSPYLVSMPLYQPITALTTDWNKFLAAFSALLYGHGALRSKRIPYARISEYNLMYNSATNRPKLCDFDFTHSSAGLDPCYGGIKCGPMWYPGTGTWIFTASELLDQDAGLGWVQPQAEYRHEIESFVAVLVWIAFRYYKGKRRHYPPLEEWNRKEYGVYMCNENREVSYSKIKRGTIPIPEGISPTLLGIIRQAMQRIIYYRARAECFSLHYDVELGSVEDIFPGKTHEDMNGLPLLPDVLKWHLFAYCKGLPGGNDFRKLWETVSLSTPLPTR